MVHDRHEPDAQIGPRLKAREATQRVLERVLHEVPRILRAADEAKGARVQDRLELQRHLFGLHDPRLEQAMCHASREYPSAAAFNPTATFSRIWTRRWTPGGSREARRRAIRLLNPSKLRKLAQLAQRSLRPLRPMAILRLS